MSQVLVHEIVVPQSVLDAKEPWELMEANCWFKDKLSGLGLFEDSEFLPECRMLYHITMYCGEVRNGGHEQFIGNKGWKSDINDLIYAGLRRIGADQFADLFQEVRTYVDADDQRLAGMKIRGGFRHPVAGQVDDWTSREDSEFYALNRVNDLLGIGSTFLRRLPALIAVPDAEWPDRIQKIADQNPYLAQRLAERKRAHEERQRAYRRKLRACEKLSAMIGQSIDATRGMIVQGSRDGLQIEAVVHRTDRGGQVAYFELDGKAIVAKHPDGDTLAEVDLRMLEH